MYTRAGKFATVSSVYIHAHVLYYTSTMKQGVGMAVCRDDGCNNTMYIQCIYVHNRNCTSYFYCTMLN